MSVGDPEASDNASLFDGLVDRVSGDPEAAQSDGRKEEAYERWKSRRVLPPRMSVKAVECECGVPCWRLPDGELVE